MTAGCAVFRPGDSLSREEVSELELTPIRTKHRYLTSADITQTQLRTALIDVTFRGERMASTFAVGQWRPREGVFKYEELRRDCNSLQALISALDSHIDRMPVGIILTIGGAPPGSMEAPPPAFAGFVKELQAELDREKILYAFLLPTHLHLLE